MSAESVIAGYLVIALEDLKGARLLASAQNRNATYLAQQAAEKIIRAVLTSEGKHAGTRHQLDEMIDAIPDDNPLKAEFRAVEHLSAYATTYRYPTDVGRVKAPRPASALTADLNRLEALLDQVAGRFGVPLDGSNSPAVSSKPIR